MNTPAKENAQQKPVLVVSGLGKTYRIFRSPKDRLKQAVLDGLSRRGLIKRPPKLYSEKVALKEINFELRRGEALGIVGKNGAGKSTLLQLIAGTLTSTQGSIQLDGSVTSLLELGTGFAPDFTGRENIFIAGQINGHSKAEVETLEHDIIAFADIGEYIDQPVRTYSSGMMMRLAFAVQTAVKPDLLIVDEAMAVGDIDFQAKCMLRMQEIRRAGAAVLFVSHSPSTVIEVCTEAILLEQGTQVARGSPDQIIYEYKRSTSSYSTRQPLDNIESGDLEDRRKVLPNQIAEDAPLMVQRKLIEFKKNSIMQRSGNQKIIIENVLLIGESGTHQDAFRFGEQVTCSVFVYVTDDVPYLNFAYRIRTINGVPLIYGDTQLYTAYEFSFEGQSRYKVDFKFKMNLVHGRYTVGAGVSKPTPKYGADRDWEQFDHIPICRTFKVMPRSKGMIDENVVWENTVDILKFAPPVARGE